MTSVFRLHPEDLKKKIIYLNNIKNISTPSYNFLDNVKETYQIDIDIYYLIISLIEEFKLKNLLYFINLRIKKIGEKINYDKVDKENINNILNDYINSDIVKSIMVMNFIQQYIYPLHNPSHN